MTDHTAIQETDEMRQQWAKHIEQGAPKREWVGLTTEESSEIYNKNYDKYDTDMTYMDFYIVQREVEAKLKEKNGG